MKIVIAAGGTGGHLLPAQQLAEALQENAEVIFAGHRLDSSPFFQRSRFSFEAIPAAPVKLSLRGLLVFFRDMIQGVWKSIRLIRSFQPDAVVGFGSFHSFPLLLAACLLRRHIVLFEANCQLGKVNRLFAGRARFVAAQFSLKNPVRRLQFVPILPWNKLPALIDRTEAKKRAGLDPNRLTFLVFGGSQGALFLNEMIPLCLPASVQVVHLAGNEHSAAETAKCYNRAGIVAIVKGFESNMPMLYAVADLVICRSGAGTIAELIRFALPSLLIPFPYATDDHQTANAEFLVKQVGGASMLAEHTAQREAISKAIEELIGQSTNYQAALVRFRDQCEGRVSLDQQILQMGNIV